MLKSTARRRKTRLEQQLAEARFPSGVGVPSGIVLALALLLAGFCAAYLEQPATREVPRAVLESQERFAETTGRSLVTSVVQDVADLRYAATQAVSTPRRDPNELLGALGEIYPRWRGMALLSRSTGRMVAARGEPVPLEALDRVAFTEATVRPVARPGGGVVMLAAVPLPGAEERLLAASIDLSGSESPLDERLRQSVLVVTAAGLTLDSRGPVPSADDQAMHALIRQAAAESAAGRAGSKVGIAAGGDSRQGNGKDTAVVPVVAYAPLSVAWLSGTLGLSLVSVTHVPAEEGKPIGHRLVPAAALVAVALFGFALIRAVLVGPVRRLRADATAVAAGDLGRRVRISRVSEVRRIATAIEHYRARLRGAAAGRPVRRPGLSARQAIVLSTVAMLGWSVFVALTVGVAPAAAPDVLVRERGTEASRAADSVRRSLNEGVSDLKVLGRFGGSGDATALRPVMERLVEQEARYRSVYVVDSDGRVGVHVGRLPLRAEERLPPGEGVRQYNTGGRVPVVYAYTPMPDGRHAVVGEFDVANLSRLLKQSAGRVRLVDSGLRTIADTEGYLAFRELSEEVLRRSARDALAGKPGSGVTEAGSGPAVVAAAALGGHGAVAALRWVVVADQPVSALSLPGNELRRRALMAGMLGTVIALLLLGWHELMLVRPLRRAVASAERFVDGDTDSVIYPVRQDHIGTITSCLEICRRELVDGAHRLGDGARIPAAVPVDRESYAKREVEAGGQSGTRRGATGGGEAGRRSVYPHPRAR